MVSFPPKRRRRTVAQPFLAVLLRPSTHGRPSPRRTETASRSLPAFGGGPAFSSPPVSACPNQDFVMR
jgi:hypothetical protein